MKTKIVNKKSANNDLKQRAQSKSLLLKAVKALTLAYAPYSEFYVGCALLMSNGQIYLGANIENASYPLCLCAERTALAHAHVSAPKSKIHALAVVCKSSKHQIHQPVSPCGACRQVISEFEDKQNKAIKIIIGNLDGTGLITFQSIKELLPHSFNSHYLL